MEIVKLEPGFSFKGPLALALGTFDGLHKGHQKLLIDAALKTSYPLGILLFDGNPALYLHNGKSPLVLTSLDDKIRLLRRLHLDYAFILPVDVAFFSLSPESFITSILLKLGVKEVYVGSDYRFGKGGAGDPSLLKKYFQVGVEPLLSLQGEKVSTQRIIQLLQSGKVEAASALLGRDYEISGRVKKGFQRGRGIGFPTLNLDLAASYVLPQDGVYAGVTYLRGHPYQSLLNVGTNPTIGLLREDQIEVYLDGYDGGEAYGESVYVSFAKFRRLEMKFSSLEELKGQLQKDLDWLRKIEI